MSRIHRLCRNIVLAAVVAASSATAVHAWAQAPPAVDAHPRMTVTVQQLIDSGHRLTVAVGTEVFWNDPHFQRVWFPSGALAARVERTAEGFRTIFTRPGTYRGAFTIVGGHRSDDVYPLVVTVTER